MWNLKIAEGKGPYLFSTNNYVDRQIWEFDLEAGTSEEREAVEQVRQEYRDNFKKDRTRAPPCADLLMQMQENKNIDLSIPVVRLGETEDVNYEALTTALRKAIRLNRAIQSSDGHWPAENSVEYTNRIVFSPLISWHLSVSIEPITSVTNLVQLIILYISGAINPILTAEHKKELIRYIYLHQNDDGGWGFYIEGHSAIIGSALSYVALRLLGEGLDDGENGAMTKLGSGFLTMVVQQEFLLGERPIFRFDTTFFQTSRNICGNMFSLLKIKLMDCFESLLFRCYVCMNGQAAIH
ncbi:hypothetical protein RHMOL_Rhmol03G0105400 [Rhododendron molle]|uniref:Uncharacterized protein n=1 Tax=Rhododendron molle TaxID=49168 RepID=A0ACC0PF55_RHOML|nr:hypothetical protein RHMOL_Rhmol03G0105400 [Rhododendron molle]